MPGISRLMIAAVLFSGCSILTIDIPTEYGMIHLHEIRPWGKRETMAEYNPVTKQMALSVDTSIEHIDPQVLGAAIGVALQVLKKSSGLP